MHHLFLFLSASVAPLQVDPLVGQLLRSQQLRGTTLSELSTAASGLAAWRRALTAGRVPDFDGVDTSSAPWPPQPLLGSLSDAMGKLGLPRTTARHPSLVPAALAAVLAATARFGDEADRAALARSRTETMDGGDWEDEQGSMSYFEDDESEALPDEEEGEEEGADGEEQRLAEAAEAIAAAMANEWGAPLRAVRAVEALGGADGGADAGALTAAAGATFSPADGLWRHTGWRELDAVQRQLGELTELTKLIQHLGQRPSAQGVVRRGAASVADSRAAPSAALCEHAPREICGLSRTGVHVCMYVCTYV